MGFSTEYAHLSRQAGLPRPYELALEGLYQVQLAKWVSFMPDLQYISHPGGQHPNALVGTCVWWRISELGQLADLE